MSINELIESRNITKYRLSKKAQIPYATLSDICSGKSDLSKCSSETVYRLAKELNVTMEELLAPCLEKRPAYELFKSNVCHRLKNLGDINFLIEELQSDNISAYYEKKWYPESFYLLAMVDYISRINDVPLCDEYKEIRRQKLKTVLYPSSILSIYGLAKNEQIKRDAVKHAIPEFMRFNIVESEIRNVN